MVGSGRGRPDLIKLLLEQEESWVTERPDRLRADAGLVRHVLLGCRADHGLPPSGDPTIGGSPCNSALMGTCPTSGCSPRPSPSSRQRLRRDLSELAGVRRQTLGHRLRGHPPLHRALPLDRRAIVQAGVRDYQERIRWPRRCATRTLGAHMERRCGHRLDQRRAEREASGEERREGGGCPGYCQGAAPRQCAGLLQGGPATSRENLGFFVTRR